MGVVPIALLYILRRLSRIAQKKKFLKLYYIDSQFQKLNTS